MPIRILYVDDEADIREVAAMALELDRDFEVRTCQSGFEGLGVALSWKPDLILLDVMMPEMDGPTTFAKLQEQADQTPPVIFITARTQAHEVERFKALGARGVIAKPFDPMTLAQTVRHHLNG
ncbi:response regulator [Sphingosinicella rhizophila]|uniref:Response regulator n=1 Tax=Sphingosinicella rhizophila TaxID=3050082 RepID=A0ABU3QB93_9SPHN|nr:response regulator [Sphingosinicella sp. GR2756]MDT9600675.1 response regulator [Sphingosinicella sp. GR2756]